MHGIYVGCRQDDCFLAKVQTKYQQTTSLSVIHEDFACGEYRGDLKGSLKNSNRSMSFIRLGGRFQRDGHGNPTRNVYFFHKINDKMRPTQRPTRPAHPVPRNEPRHCGHNGQRKLLDITEQTVFLNLYLF